MAMTNPFKSFLPRKTMGHAAFERTMCMFEDIHQNSVNSGDKPIGHLRRDNGAVLPEVGACGKGGRRVNTEAIKDFIRYLEREGQRFDPIQVGNALTALKAVKGGKALDLSFLAERFHNLIDTKVLTTDFDAVRRQIRTETNKAYEGANGLVDGSARRVRFKSSTAKAIEQARKEEAIARGRQFSEACLSGPQQKHPKEAKRLFRWLSGEFGGSDLTRSIGVNALPGLVEAHARKLMDQKAALEQLLAQAGSRDHDPAYHEEVTKLSNRYMFSQAVHIQTLAFVANVLGAHRDPIDLPPDFRLPTTDFAQSLVNLATALQAPGSDFMDDNQWAAKSKAAAAKRLAELSAPKNPVAAPEGRGYRVDQLEAVGAILATDPQLGKPTPALDAARIAAGNRMLQLNFLEQDANGELMSVQAFARQARDNAQRELNQPRMTPASKVRGAPPRPLDSEPAHMDEHYFDQQVNEAVETLLALDPGSVRAQDSETRGLLTKPIRASRPVDAQTATTVEAVPAKSSLTADFELGHARLPNRVSQWEDVLEDVLSGVDEIVTAFDAVDAQRPASASVQRPPLVRRGAVLDLNRPQPTGIARTPLSTPTANLPLDSNPAGIRVDPPVGGGLKPSAPTGSQGAQRASVDVLASQSRTVDRRVKDAQLAMERVGSLIRSIRGSAAPDWKKALWANLEAQGIDPDYMVITLVSPPSSLQSRHESLKKHAEGNLRSGNNQGRFEAMLRLSQEQKTGVDQYLNRLGGAATAFSEMAASLKDQPALAELFNNVASSLAQLEQAQRDARSPLMVQLNECQRLGKQAQAWLGAL